MGLRSPACVVSVDAEIWLEDGPLSDTFTDITPSAPSVPAAPLAPVDVIMDTHIDDL